MKARSAILTYHSLDDGGSPVSVAPERFRAQMEWLAQSGIPVAPLERIRETPGSVAITFDDGFQNFRRQALDVLVRYGLPATVFVVSSHVGGWNNWRQPVAGIPCLPLMGWAELEEAARAGIALGAHTETHAFLGSLEEREIEREMAVCRTVLEDRLGRPVECFAYPYGDVSPPARRVAGRHFRLACGTRLAFARPGSDPLELPRIDAYYLRSGRWFESLGHAGGTAYIAARRWMRQAAAIAPHLGNPFATDDKSAAH